MTNSAFSLLITISRNKGPFSENAVLYHLFNYFLRLAVSDKGGRDDSRDWYYESDEFWEMPDSNRRCGRGQGLDASGANCG